ncbi:Retrovirus-related Pol poly from transposon, partial [Paramuricea clavata]
MVKSCSPCQHHQNLNTKEPLVSHDVPPRPWHTLGSDIFHWNNADYLLVTDYYSKFPVIRKLPNLQSSTVVANLKAIFEEHGIPSKMISDNDTQYTSSTFQEFSRTYGFTHVTSSPMYPQSNGLSERAVQTVKRLLQKCKESNLDPHLAMLCLRSTPLSHDLPSPAELLNSRIYQTNLPAVSSPSCSASGDVNVKLQHRQDQKKILYGKPSKSLPTLPVRSHVRFFDPGSNVWQPGTIQGVASTPRSYVVETERGSFLRRNRKHLHPTGESFSGDSEIQLSDNIPFEVCATSKDLQADDARNQMSTSEDPTVQSSPIHAS